MTRARKILLIQIIAALLCGLVNIVCEMSIRTIENKPYLSHNRKDYKS